MSEENALSKGNNRKPAKRTNKGEVSRDSRTNRTPDVTNGVNNAVNKSLEETEIIRAGVKQAKEQISDSVANELLDEIADIPNATLQKFSELASEHTSNPQFFRERATSVSNQLLEAFGIDTTK